MITSVCFLILLVTVPLLGGSLIKLGTIRLNAWWTIAASLVIQVFLIEIFAGTLDGMFAAVIHLGSYALALMFVWHNRHVSGMGLMVFGGILNLMAIAANGGVMPARLEALETAGIITDSVEFENSAPVENARLAFLGDVFAIPEKYPFANVFSIGDILLVLGGGVTVHTVGDSKLGRLRTRSKRAMPVLAEDNVNVEATLFDYLSEASAEPASDARTDGALALIAAPAPHVEVATAAPTTTAPSAEGPDEWLAASSLAASFETSPETPPANSFATEARLAEAQRTSSSAVSWSPTPQMVTEARNTALVEEHADMIDGLPPLDLPSFNTEPSHPEPPMVDDEPDRDADPLAFAFAVNRGPTYQLPSIYLEANPADH